jgi:hypothetical protein
MYPKEDFYKYVKSKINADDKAGAGRRPVGLVWYFLSDRKKNTSLFF